jgi:hypothetical protein
MGYFDGSARQWVVGPTPSNAAANSSRRFRRLRDRAPGSNGPSGPLRRGQSRGPHRGVYFNLGGAKAVVRMSASRPLPRPPPVTPHIYGDVLVTTGQAAQLATQKNPGLPPTGPGQAPGALSAPLPLTPSHTTPTRESHSSAGRRDPRRRRTQHPSWYLRRAPHRRLTQLVSPSQPT